MDSCYGSPSLLKEEMELSQPRVFLHEEIWALLPEVTSQEFEQAEAHSLTRLKRQILHEGQPAVLSCVTWTDMSTVIAPPKHGRSMRATAI